MTTGTRWRSTQSPEKRQLALRTAYNPIIDLPADIKKFSEQRIQVGRVEVTFENGVDPETGNPILEVVMQNNTNALRAGKGRGRRRSLGAEVTAASLKVEIFMESPFRDATAPSGILATIPVALPDCRPGQTVRTPVLIDGSTIEGFQTSQPRLQGVDYLLDGVRVGIRKDNLKETLRNGVPKAPTPILGDIRDVPRDGNFFYNAGIDIPAKLLAPNGKLDEQRITEYLEQARKDAELIDPSGAITIGGIPTSAFVMDPDTLLTEGAVLTTPGKNFGPQPSRADRQGAQEARAEHSL